MVEEDLYRSGMPNELNFPFLERLELKTVVVLASEELSQKFLDFMDDQEITLKHFGATPGWDPISEEVVLEVLEVLLDARCYPMLVLCGQGKHRTGTIVGCLRKLQNWSLTSIFEEYRRYAGSKVRVLNEQFIELFDIDLVSITVDFSNPRNSMKPPAEDGELQFPVGFVCTLYGSRAVIRFNGQTAFAPGTWIGLELDEPVGKNDGSVQGQRYFQCQAGHGVFIRAALLQKELQTTSSTKPHTDAGSKASGINSSSSSSSSTINSRRKSSSISPPTSRRVTGIGLPAAPSSTSAAVASANPSTHSSSNPILVAAAVNNASGGIINNASNTTNSQSSGIHTPPTPANVTVDNTSGPSFSDPRRATMGARPAATQMVPLKDMEELKLKLKILEGKRAEDRDRLKDYEKLKNEVEQLQLAKSKLSVKLEEHQRELSEVKRTTKDSSQAVQGAEEKIQELTEQCELLTLDKEMAEERAETLQLEVDSLKERVEELSLDLEVIQQEREENQLASGSSGEANSTATAASSAQLEKQIERLKEALIKLRDVSSVQEVEHNKRIKALERELQSLQQFKALYETAKKELTDRNETIELLKEQLDAANENNDMIEQLTEQNLKLSELVDQQKIIIQDLEADKELNEELEENHVQAERELMEQLEQRDTVIRDQLAAVDTARERVADYENTIVQFRQLTQNLQSDLSHLREKYQVTEDENRHLSSQSQTMLNLNLQLQSSAAKSTAKAVELELKKLDAEQSELHLQYIQPYLPHIFFNQDSNGIMCLLLIRRLNFKCHMARRFIDETLKDQATAKSDTILALKQKLTWSAALSARLAAFIENSPPELFIQLGETLSSLTPVESRINQVLDAIKDERLDSGVVAVELLAELQRALSQLEMLNEAVASVGGAAQESVISDFFGAIGYSCDLVAHYANRHLGNISDSFSKSTRKLVSSCNSLKSSAIKLAKAFSDSFVEGKCATENSLATIQEWLYDVEKVCSVMHKISQHIGRTRIESGHLEDIVIRMLREQFNFESLDPLRESLERIALSASSLEENIMMHGEGVETAVFSSINPWTARAETLKAEYSANVELDLKNKKMTEELAALGQELKLKNEKLQQNSIKIDLLESRMRNLREKSDVVNHYENEMETLKSQERSYLDTIETLQHELEALERENRQLNSAIKEMEKRGGGADKSLDSSAISHIVPSGAAGLVIDNLISENRSLKAKQTKQKYHDLFFDSLQQWQKNSKLRADRMRAQKRLNQEFMVLLKDIYSASADLAVVDLAKSPPKGKWMSQKLLPEYQFYRQQSLIQTLQQRVDILGRKISEDLPSLSRDSGCRKLANLWLPERNGVESKSKDRRSVGPGQFVMQTPGKISHVLKHQQTPGPVNVVRFNSTGQYCMTGGQDKLIKLWNPHEGKLINTYTGHGWEVLGVAIAKDNTKFGSCGGDKMVYFWDVSTSRILRKFQGHFHRVNCVDFNEEATVLVSGSFDSTIRVWDCRSNIRTPIMVLEDGKDSISSVQVTGHEIISGSIDGGIRIYDIRKGTLTIDRVPNPVTSVRLSTDGNCLLASTLDNSLRLVDKETGELLNCYSAQNSLRNNRYKIESTFSNTDSHVISGSETGEVLIWELVEATLVKSLKGHSRSVLSVSYHPVPDQPLLLSSSSDGTAILWGPEVA